MNLYSAAKVITRKLNRHNQINPLPLVLPFQRSDYQQSGERNPSDQMAFVGEILKLGGEVLIQ